MNRRDVLTAALASLPSALVAGTGAGLWEDAHFISWQDDVSTHPAHTNGLTRGWCNHFTLDGRDVSMLLVMRAVTGPAGWLEVRANDRGEPGRHDRATNTSDPPVCEFYDVATGAVLTESEATVERRFGEHVWRAPKDGCGERVKTVVLRGDVRYEHCPAPDAPAV
jgi:hypothetical protein